jgi:D-arabinose 1-dehydrogenase-like Zn-dependent alcohol dehydrogenase
VAINAVHPDEFLALAAEISIRDVAAVYPLGDANLALERLTAGDVSGAAVLTV